MNNQRRGQGISLVGAGHASSLTLAISFTLCVGFDLAFPDHAMYAAWQKLLPGFEWISWSSFFLGLIESYGYGWFFTLLWVPLYNVFSVKRQNLQCSMLQPDIHSQDRRRTIWHARVKSFPQGHGADIFATGLVRVLSGIPSRVIPIVKFEFVAHRPPRHLFTGFFISDGYLFG